ncbi:MAG TPA: TonB-dependent receptor, partial [Chromatiales bacterium]|nr:TonB-dependent receptor [Chromatiales bacterium]
KLLRQPEWTSSISLDYQRPVWRDWDGFARIDTNYQDKIFLGNDNQSWVPPRFVSNLNFGVESDRVTLNFWVRNLFNDDKPVAAFRDIFWSNTDNIFPPFMDPGPLPNPGFDKFPPFRYTATYPALRTMGVTLQVRFGGLAR